MTDKRFTRAEINEIVEDKFIHVFKMYYEYMSFGEKLMFKKIMEEVSKGIDYKLESKEND